MVRKGNPVEESPDSPLAETVIPAIPTLIVTKSDSGLWVELCEWLGLSPKGRQVRYITVGQRGIAACTTKGLGPVATWDNPGVNA